MKLLILTQKVDADDPILGFFHRWILEFSKKFEKVYVVCLQKGRFDLPANVEVFSLGKERGENKIQYVFNFYKYIFRLNNKYDAVFVHMNPEYLVLGGFWWRLVGKKTALWYIHRAVNLKLQVATFFANKIFTISKETFNLASPKIKMVGHGIPLAEFKKPENFQRKDDKFRLVSVGRVAPIKNLEIFLEATRILQKDVANLEVVIVGGPVKKEDVQYLEKLKKMVIEKKLEKIVLFAGDVAPSQIRDYYWNSDISVNLAPTGGVDKAILESMAAGALTLASNGAFTDYFGEYKNQLLFAERDPKDLANKIIALKDNHDKAKIKDFLLVSVAKKASLDSLIYRITEELQ